MKKSIAEPNGFQKFIGRMLSKAVGHPAWTGSYGLTDPLLAAMLRGADTYAGVSVSGDKVLNLSAAWGCISILSKVIGSFPVDAVKKSGRLRVPVDHPVAELLSEPNEYMDSMQFMEAVVASWCMYPHAFVEILRIGGTPKELWPRNPARVQMLYESGKLSYKYTDEDGRQRLITAENMIRVSNFSVDGLKSYSPTESAREVFGKALAANRYGASWFRNGGVPSGGLKFPEGKGPKDEKAKDRLREGLATLHGGSENAGRPLLLFDGAEWFDISTDPEKSQLIEVLKMSAAEIAALYGVPMNLLAMSDKSATYASAEQFNRYFVDYTLGPLCVRLEKAFKKALLPNEKDVSIKFNLDALLRGDSASRATYLAAMVASGLMTPNEARAKENLPPMPGGDELIVQSNMTVLDALKLLAANQVNQPAPANVGGNQ